MTDAALPQLGAFGVVRTNGWQAWWIRRITRSPVNHAVVYVGNGQIVEAEPHGAVVSPVSKYSGTIIWSRRPMPDAIRQQIADIARRRVGTKYSWLDCLAIGIAKVTHEKVPPFIRRHLSQTDHEMCSQEVDQEYLEAGEHLFDDGRLPGDVSPGDLYDLILAGG